MFINRHLSRLLQKSKKSVLLLGPRQALEMGTLPGIYAEEDPAERIKTLRSYAATYVKEEVQAEALTRNLEGFSRFLFIAAQCSGRFLDLTKLASESQITRQSAIRASDDRKVFLFEHLIFNQLVSTAASFDQDLRVTTYRTEPKKIEDVDILPWQNIFPEMGF